jgi:hypothetical protein
MQKTGFSRPLYFVVFLFKVSAWLSNYVVFKIGGKPSYTIFFCLYTASLDPRTYNLQQTTNKTLSKVDIERNKIFLNVP